MAHACELSDDAGEDIGEECSIGIDFGDLFRPARETVEEDNEDRTPGSDVVIARQVAAFVVLVVVCIVVAIALAARMDWHGIVRDMLKWMHAGP